ncbi:glycosyltransferase family 9 protein [Streptomyces sp. DSM 44915]|uniref:Glycosyltransferase family 9 protein n=1 Tax=Streptomyces chisholmiae TaxID=3075540 RepID=A0ABU2JLG6_9ACTN|nr:glycosyltransferase family 9 protein [Streptomyces sp. DSM 44915]MDT0265832.1 glycosyltransferase family 9 protein [Streptomyces sp. DSM 44915]
MSRVLVLRALGLGDLLTAVPALRAVRRSFPAHRLLLAAPESLAGAVAALDCVDELVPTVAPGREVPARVPWRGPAPELAIDLHGNGPASLRPLLALRPARTIGYALLPPDQWAEREHERERWCRLLRRHGMPADPTRLGIAAPAVASPAPGAVVVHPGADAGARRWPAERFAAVARSLGDRTRVVVTAGPGEEPLAQRVAALAGLPAGAVLAGLPFPTLSALVAEASAVVVGDTGVAHLATAHGTPSVVLFGPVSPALWGPPPGRRHRALWHPDPADGARPGDPHGAAPDARLARISVAEVREALAEVTGGRADRTLRRP